MQKFIFLVVILTIIIIDEVRVVNAERKADEARLMYLASQHPDHVSARCPRCNTTFPVSIFDISADAKPQNDTLCR